MHERQRLGYQPSLDGVRAIAVAGVIGIHYYRWPIGGAQGVELFFVLSGFLITTLLLEEWQRWGDISLTRFYARRSLRLLPALWFFLLVAGVAMWWNHHFDALSFVYGFFYLMNISSAFGFAPNAHLLGHLWSLANEEQFYLLWPLGLLAMLRGRMRQSGMIWCAALVVLAILVMRDIYGFGYLFLFRFDAILVGCVAGILFAGPGRPALRRFCCAPPVAAAAATMVLYLMLRPPVWVLKTAGLTIRPENLVFSVCVAVTLVWIVEGCPGFAPARWVLSSPPFVYVGRISYALYLWHPLVIHFMLWRNVPNETLVRVYAIVGSLVAASVSYHLVERRFLRMKWRLSRTESHDADVHLGHAESPPDVAGLEVAR